VDDLVRRAAAGAEVARCGFGAVADGDGADRLVVIGDAERRTERADRFRHDAEVQRGQALVDHGEQDQQRGHPGVDVPERHRPAVLGPVGPALVRLGVAVQVHPLR